MPTTGLNLAPGLTIPRDAVTMTFGVLGQKGAGKTSTIVVLTEEMIRAGLPVVILDPKGDWWGIRSSADGKHPGLPVTILGGEYGDIPLKPNAGKVIAELVATTRRPWLLDVSEFNNTEQATFVGDFATRLFRFKQRHREPLHVVLEEAQEFAPQNPGPGQQTMLGAVQKLVLLGRQRGIGVTMASQRSARVNKNVLYMVDTLIALRTIAPGDRTVIKEWVEGHADKTQRDLVLSSLASLRNGEGWVYSPAWLKILERVQFRMRETFDSSKTPEVGDIAEVKAWAPVDLDALRETMAATIEEAENNDPAKLRARIAQLERELRTRKPETTVETVTETVTVTEVVERVPADVVSDLRELLDVYDDAIGTVMKVRERMAATRDHLVELAAAGDQVTARSVPERPLRGPAGTSRRTEPAAKPRSAQVAAPQAGDNPVDIKLGKAERKVMSVLAQFPDGRTRQQLSMLTGYSAKASTLDVAASRLRRVGYMEPNGFKATPLGIANTVFEPLPTGDELIEHWKNQPKMGRAEKAVLDILIDAYPEERSRDELCEITGYSPAASTMDVTMSRLRKYELADGWKASDAFMEAIR